MCISLSAPPIQPVNGRIVFFRKGHEKSSTQLPMLLFISDGSGGTGFDLEIIILNGSPRFMLFVFEAGASLMRLNCQFYGIFKNDLSNSGLK